MNYQKIPHNQPKIFEMVEKLWIIIKKLMLVSKHYFAYTKLSSQYQILQENIHFYFSVNLKDIARRDIADFTIYFLIPDKAKRYFTTIIH